MGAEVYVYDRSIDRLRELEVAAQRALLDRASPRRWRSSSGCREVDLVIGAVLVHGAKAPHVITRAQLGLMKRNSVLVDVSIDQGGCFETSRPTTHSDPTYEVDGITHYCVANMPGAVPITSHLRADQRDDALRRAARRPRACTQALTADPGFMRGLNVAAGQVTYEPVPDQGLDVDRRRTRRSRRCRPPEAARARRRAAARVARRSPWRRCGRASRDR